MFQVGKKKDSARIRSFFEGNVTSCPLVFGVAREVLMDYANFVPSFTINEQRECSKNVETLILDTKYSDASANEDNSFRNYIR